MTSRIPALAILLVLSLLASACGGGGDDAATDASPAPTAESSPDPTGGATPETTPDPTSEATPDITPEATPTSPAVGPPPVDPADAEMLEELLPQIPPLSAPPTVDDAAELPNDHLADMFEAVLAAMVQDPPIIDAAVSGAVEERWMPEVVPDLVIRTFAIDQAVTARVMGVIEAWAEAGAAGVYAPDPTTYFATRSAAARNLRQANELAVEILSAALDLPLEDRLCVAESLRTASNECDGPAADLIDPVFDISLSDLELPDDADDDVGDEALCEAWDSAVDSLGLDPATVESIEYAIDDSLADTRFLNRSECRYEADLDEDVEADLDEGYDALENIYAAAIDVVLEAGGVPEDGENGVPLDYDPELLALEARTIFAAAREAALSYQNVDESVARFQLMALVDVGASTAQLQSSWADIDRRILALGTEALECWYESDFSERANCDPGLEQFVAEDTAAFEAFTAQHGFSDTVEWDDFDDLYEDRCDVWVGVARSYPPEQYPAIEMAVEYLEAFYSNLDLRGCETLT